MSKTDFTIVLWTDEMKLPQWNRWMCQWVDTFLKHWQGDRVMISADIDSDILVEPYQLADGVKTNYKI